MEFRASHMHARISARKARYVVDLVRGLDVNDALDSLKFLNRRAKPMVEKVIRSALANAEQNVDVDIDELYISRAVVDEGPLLGGRGRWRPISRGRAVPILKRTSHIKITLSERTEEEPEEKPVVKKAAKKADEGKSDSAGEKTGKES